MKPTLYPHQKEAVLSLHNGSILRGGVGTGKSITALGYYDYIFGDDHSMPLYIITTAHKRDSKEWDEECARWGIPFEHNTPLTIDSWNNIEKYKNVTDAFFIFDEHKAIGSGVWAKTFVKIARMNKWILLTATPGDVWMDYWAVFVANGFYKNKTDFINQHVIINPYVSYFSVKEYINVRKLIFLRDKVLVEMPYKKPVTYEEVIVNCRYNKSLYAVTLRNRWDPFEDKPIENPAALCYCLRKIVNMNKSRINQLQTIISTHDKVIVFYNFDYELELLLKGIDDRPVTQWNGHQHDPISTENKWVHLVQYTAGAEGWNCIETNVIAFYSQTYSYKTLEQAKGRIDRLNTPFDTLYYYIFVSDSDIDKAISNALLSKKEFNAKKYVERLI